MKWSFRFARFDGPRPSATFQFRSSSNVLSGRQDDGATNADWKPACRSLAFRATYRLACHGLKSIDPFGSLGIKCTNSVGAQTHASTVHVIEVRVGSVAVLSKFPFNIRLAKLQPLPILSEEEDVIHSSRQDLAQERRIVDLPRQRANQPHPCRHAREYPGETARSRRWP